MRSGFIKTQQLTRAPRANSSLLFWFFLFLAAARPTLAQDRCASCGELIQLGTIYILEDKVTLQKVEVCRNCEISFGACFICGLPANTNLEGFVALEDGRALCARDAKTAVLREDEGIRTFHAVRDSLERMFARFTGFPDANIKVEMVDRVHLQELFTVVGNDYHCPNIFGYTQSKFIKNRPEHRISLMTGLPLAWLQGTCAHELSHTWVAENVPAARRQRLARETEEGFCELVAYLLADSQRDETAKAIILHNGYTRGQIDLFVAANNTYGFNDVLDWMRYGVDSGLSTSDPTRIHQVVVPAQGKPAPAAGYFVARAAPTPPPATTLALKAIFWDAKRPSALINDHTFGVQEEGKLRLGTSNVTVRCVAIRQNAVRIRVNGSAEEKELVLKPK